MAGGYASLDSPLLLSPHFVDQFTLDGTHLCTGVSGTGFSALLNRHLGEECWADLKSGDLRYVHFQKAGERKLLPAVDEIIPNMTTRKEIASGTATYSSSLTDDVRPCAYLQVDVTWRALGSDSVLIDRLVKQVWFDSSIVHQSSATVGMTGASAMAFVEAVSGRRSSHLELEHLSNPRIRRAQAL